jgi:Tfp pilus assembly protein FimT
MNRNHNHIDRSRKIRGLSTAELVGIIVIVGILGALGGTYVKGLVDQASLNAGNQNATSLQGVYDSAIAAGAKTNGDTGYVAGNAGMIDTSTIATAIAALNAGVTVTASTPGAAPVVFKMSPTLTLTNPANYIIANAGTDTATFTFAGAGFSP